MSISQADAIGPKKIYFRNGDVVDASEIYENEEPQTPPWTLWKQQKETTTFKTWSSWSLFYVKGFLYGSLHAVDTLGEKLANLLGVTSPKYQYVIDIKKRMDEEEKEFQDLERLELEAIERRRSERAGMEQAGGATLYASTTETADFGVNCVAALSDNPCFQLDAEATSAPAEPSAVPL